MVNKVALTGSTETGRQVMRMAADTVKKVSLEPGGKSPTLVLEDADLDLAVDGALFGTIFHAGQVCESGTRCFVPVAICDTFMARMLERIGHIRVGDPQDFDTTMGPVVSRAQWNTVMGCIEADRQEGARLLCGGRRPPQMAHDSIDGLGGAVFSRDAPRVIAIAKRIRTGTVWINDYHRLNALAPFRGYKQSGVGRELGPHGLLEYTQVTHIHVDLTADRSKRFRYDCIFND